MKKECCTHDCGQSDRCPLRLAGEAPERGYLLALLLWFLAIVVVALSMTGCVKRDAAPAAKSGPDAIYSYYADTNGCEYVGNSYGPTAPRTAADGKTQMGCKGAKP